MGNIDVGVENYMDLRKALQIGDWKAAEEFLDRHPLARGAKITVKDQTALHVAAEAGHVHIVEKLVNQMSKETLEIKDDRGSTALAVASFNGNYRMVESMLGKNVNLIGIADGKRDFPVILALVNGHLKLGRYIYLLTPPEILMLDDGRIGAKVVCEAIDKKAFGKN